MILKEYAESINKLAEKYPDLLVVYSADDEGNTFRKLRHLPMLGFFETKEDFFYDIELVKQYPEEYDYYVGQKPKAICIN